MARTGLAAASPVFPNWEGPTGKRFCDAHRVVLPNLLSRNLFPFALSRNSPPRMGKWECGERLTAGFGFTRRATERPQMGVAGRHLSSGDSDHEGAAGGLHYILGNDGQLVEAQDALNLNEEAV